MLVSVAQLLQRSSMLLQCSINSFCPCSEPLSHVDDEYSLAGVRDPKILITTSRNPSSKLQQFAKEIKLILPNAHRINRGGYVMKDLVEACRANEISDLVVLHETRGVPGRISFFSLSDRLYSIYLLQTRSLSLISLTAQLFSLHSTRFSYVTISQILGKALSAKLIRILSSKVLRLS
jgi:hypothetical protein